MAAQLLQVIVDFNTQKLCQPVTVPNGVGQGDQQSE